LTIAGSVIRARSPEQKGVLTRALLREVWPRVEAGAIRTRIQQTFPLNQAVDAHVVLENNEQRGKLVLVVDEALVAAYGKGR